MAFSNRGTNLPGIAAGADLTAAQHRFVTTDSTGRAVLSGAGARVGAVVENDPNTGQAATLMGPGSVSKVEAGAAIALGADVASDSLGRAVTAVAGDFIVGECVSAAGALGELCSVWVNPTGSSSGGLAVFSNATRPDPTTQPIGTAIFNTDDKAPNYSDGTDWRTAVGVITT